MQWYSGNVILTVIQSEPPGWRFESSVRPTPLSLWRVGSNFQRELYSHKDSLLTDRMKGGEGGGLVYEENKGSQPKFYFFLLQLHTPNSITQSTFNPLMDDDGAVVISKISHQKVWSSNPRSTKFFLIILNLKLMTFAIRSFHGCYIFKLLPNLLTRVLTINSMKLILHDRRDVGA